MSIDAFVVDFDDERAAKLPRHWRVFLVDRESGDVFGPGALWGGGEKVAFLCAGCDGEPMVEHRGHMYFRMAWMVAESGNEDMAAVHSKMKRAAEDAKSDPDNTSWKYGA